jgi:hypothetical protein
MKRILDIGLSDIVSLYHKLNDSNLNDSPLLLELDIVQKLESIGWSFNFETVADIKVSEGKAYYIYISTYYKLK